MAYLTLIDRTPAEGLDKIFRSRAARPIFRHHGRAAAGAQQPAIHISHVVRINRSRKIPSYTSAKFTTKKSYQVRPGRGVNEIKEYFHQLEHTTSSVS